jgi:twitching motility protein PilT
LADVVYVDARLGAIRIHASRGKHSPRLAIRLLARAIPELETLRLPAIIETFTSLRDGLILVCGPVGSGKTTTIASLLDRINATRSKHIVTIESPVEYTHRWLKCVVTQYEIGRDLASFGEGIRGTMRADPDILFVGELHDAETVSACLQAAETGHLVLASLHAPSSTPLAINRIIGLFGADEQERIRWRLADALHSLVGLALLPMSDGAGLRVAAEILVSTEAVRRLVREGNTHQLHAAIVAGRREGMQTLESSLSDLVAAGEIDITVARMAASHPDDVRPGPASYIRR